jgi:hypothetical protein
MPAPLTGALFQVQIGLHKAMQSGVDVRELPVFIGVLVFGLLAFCFLVLGLGSLGYEAWVYFSDGIWPPLSVIDAAAMAFSWDWLANPQSLQIVHAILEAIPFPLAALGVAIVSFAGFSRLS